jgi:alkanesulfonate monooxygenase SsuD/methylene tetrahydromethanopterin reductase-like flavin-dependent oxidoreductase (luciferase family)
MEFYLHVPQIRTSFPELIARARAAEAAGFVGMTLMDHLASPFVGEQPVYEAASCTAWVAANTENLRVGNLVLAEGYRHPSVLAQFAVSLDHASGGRFDLGIGSGSVPAEYTMFGLGDASPASRVRRLGELLAVVKALWSGRVVDHDGEFFRIRNARQLPTPLGVIPIVIGGVGPRILPVVAAHADWWNIPSNYLARLEELRSSVGDARTSVLQIVAHVAEESARADVASSAYRRFGQWGEGIVVGTSRELVEYFGGLRARSVERVYCWFTDGARVSTIAEFAEVTRLLASE